MGSGSTTTSTRRGCGASTSSGGGRSKDLADELGVNIHVIARARARFGIDAPDRRRHGRLYDADWMRRQVEAGRSHREIAAELGCSRTAVTKAVGRLGRAAH